MAELVENKDRCPKIKAIDKDLLNLPYEERLKILEEEAKSLYAFCMKKSFSDKELVTCVSKLRGPPKSATKQALNDSFNSLIFLSVLIALAAMAYASPTAQTLIAVHYKLATIKFIMPFWNYGELYNEDCLVYNSWLPEPKVEKMTKDSCKYCSNVVKLNNNTLDELSNVSPGDILKFYVMNNQPVVVTDATKDWNPLKVLTMDELSNLYQTNQFFKTYMGSCDYATEVSFNRTFYDFIGAYVEKMLPEKWHINWQNCETKAAKIIRKYYTRPYYLPEMAQAHSFNSIIAAKGNHSGTVFTMVREQNLGRWLTVVSGEILVYLSPHEDCMLEFGCKVVTHTLKAGESVLFFPEAWNFEYTVTGNDMTLAVTSALIWDKM